MNGKMKAQVFYSPELMKLEEVEIPQIKPDEVLLKVKACGICGSDIAYYFGRSPLETTSGSGPLILGHEFSGEIVEMGEMAGENSSFKLGDRVMANPVRECNACRYCARTYVNLCENKQVKGVSVNGAFAEYVTMPYTHIFSVPDGITYPEAALCEPLACASNAVNTLDVKIGEFVVVYGPGTIGLMQMQLIKARGAGKIAMVGVLDFGLQKALELGADYVFNTVDKNSPYFCDDVPGKIKKLTDGEMANRVIVPTAAKPALQGALEVSGNRATIVYFGLPSEKTILEVPLLDFMTKNKSLLVSWLAPFTWDSAQKALKSKKISMESLITHTFALDSLEEGICFMNDTSQSEKIKSVVIFDI
jgi:threonine dehydrogenase-like Zn-dependent dehydrogenase